MTSTCDLTALSQWDDSVALYVDSQPMYMNNDRTNFMYFCMSTISYLCVYIP